MHRLIVIEGVAGTGKTTFMHRLKADLETVGYTVHTYDEGTHPYLDLAYSAILTFEAKQALIQQFPALESEINRLAVNVGDKVILPYTKIEPTRITQSFIETCEKHNVHLNDDFTRYKAVYEALWRHYKGLKPNGIHIITGVFMQNHHDFLHLKKKRKVAEIISFYQRFINLLDPIVTHIEHDDVAAAINRVLAIRDASDDLWYWREAVKRELAALPLAKARRYHRDENLIAYFIDQQQSTRRLFEQLDLNHRTYRLQDDYDIVYDRLCADLRAQLKKPRKTLEM